MTYLFWTTDVSLFRISWHNFDNVLRDMLIDNLGTPASDLAWHQAQLGVHCGGLGLCSAEAHCTSAYVSSVLAPESLLSSMDTRGVMITSLDTALYHLGSRLDRIITQQELQGVPQKVVFKEIDVGNIGNF